MAPPLQLFHHPECTSQFLLRQRRDAVGVRSGELLTGLEELQGLLDAAPGLVHEALATCSPVQGALGVDGTGAIQGAEP